MNELNVTFIRLICLFLLMPYHLGLFCALGLVLSKDVEAKTIPYSLYANVDQLQFSCQFTGQYVGRLSSLKLWDNRATWHFVDNGY